MIVSISNTRALGLRGLQLIIRLKSEAGIGVQSPCLFTTQSLRPPGELRILELLVY